METNVNSQLLGKWYQVASSCSFRKNDFVDIIVFFFEKESSDDIELYFVGTRADRTKKLKTVSLEVTEKDDTSYIRLKKILYRRLSYKILTLNKDILIVSDKKMRYFSVFSKAPTMSKAEVESYLEKIDFKEDCSFHLLYY